MMTIWGDSALIISMIPREMRETISSLILAVSFRLERGEL